MRTNRYAKLAAYREHLIAQYATLCRSHARRKRVLERLRETTTAMLRMEARRAH